MHPQPGQRVLHGEQRRLRNLGLVQALLCLLCFVGRRENDRFQVQTRLRRDDLETAVELLAEKRLDLVEAPSHPDVLRPLAAEHERHGRGLEILRQRTGQHGLRVQTAQFLRGFFQAAGQEHSPDVEVLPADLQRVGHVVRIQPVGLAEVAGQVRGRFIQRTLTFGRSQQQVRGPAGAVRFRLGSLLQHHVDVRPADSERAHARPARLTRRYLPLPQLRVHEERAALEVDLGIRFLEIQARRNLPVLQRQSRLDQPRHACCSVQVADVRLHRADRAVLPLVGVLPVDLSERGDLDRIAQHRAGAVRLHVGDRLRVDVRHGQGIGDHIRLPVDRRSRVTHAVGAVVVDRRSPDDRVDVVAVPEGVLQPLQHNDAHPAAADGAAGPVVEGPAVAIFRQDHPFLVIVALFLRDRDRHAAGQSHVAGVVQKILVSQVHGNQRGGTGRLHRHARPLQVQLVGNPRGQKVFVVADRKLVALGGSDPAAPGGQKREQVRVHADAAEKADQPLVAVRVVTGVFEGVPGRLQEEPVLRVHHLHLPRRQVEEVCVELVLVLDDGPRFHVVRILHESGIHARLDQLFVREKRNGFHAVAKQIPELANVPRPGKDSGHSDDCDVQSVLHFVHPGPPGNAHFRASRSRSGNPRLLTPAFGFLRGHPLGRTSNLSNFRES